MEARKKERHKGSQAREHIKHIGMSGTKARKACNLAHSSMTWLAATEWSKFDLKIESSVTIESFLKQ